MIQPSEIPEILTKRDLFLETVKKRLRASSCNYTETYDGLKAKDGHQRHRLAAGVLLPLIFQNATGPDAVPGGSFAIMLVKRSSMVAQSGDLSFPGGMLNPIWDRILRVIFLYCLRSLYDNQTRSFLAQQDKTTAKLITLFATTAFRESREEIRLSPFRTEFLGPLPTRNLVLFERTIFPIVGFVKSHKYLHPNAEAEKIVRIPLSSFYRPDFVARLRIGTPEQHEQTMEYPCLVYRDTDGQEEILWGATFHITVEFLKIVLDYELPEWRTKPVVSKILTPAYMSGHSG